MTKRPRTRTISLRQLKDETSLFYSYKISKRVVYFIVIKYISKKPRKHDTIGQTSAELTLQLNDETSCFYSYKGMKRKANVEYKDQITADDICWGKGRVTIPLRIEGWPPTSSTSATRASSLSYTLPTNSGYVCQGLEAVERFTLNQGEPYLFSFQWFTTSGQTGSSGVKP
jgi:hypothetical protein